MPSDSDRGLDVEVIIPHHNRVESLRRTLAALRSQTVDAPVCVVDNASTDGSSDLMPREFPEVRYLRLGHNAGFSAAVNAGIQSSGAEFIVLLNNDALPAPGFVKALLRAHAQTGADMVAGCLVAPDGTVESLGIEVDQSLIAYDVLHGRPLAEAEHGAHRPLAPTGGAAGFARSLLEEVGGFDEAMFAYLEDVELGIRCRLAGARCAIAPDAVAWHRHSGTLGSGSQAKNRLMGANRGYILWKHGANLSWRERARGAVIDVVVYAGQIVTDHNVQALRGRMDRLRPAAVRPAPHPNFREVPRTRLSIRRALRRRLRRRSTGTDQATRGATQEAPPLARPTGRPPARQPR